MYIDLSVPITVSTPVYPGDPVVKIEPAGVFEKDGYNDHYVSLGTHVGTHIDAPLHMLEDGKSLDQFSIEKFIGRGRYIKVENSAFNLDVVENAGLQEGDIVIFDTGMSSQYNDPSYFEDYPALPEEIAHYLVQKKVSIVGFDMCSPDHEPFTIHKILLSGAVLIIENLTNLHQLADKEFTIHALPMKLAIDGAPVRVIAAAE